MNLKATFLLSCLNISYFFLVITVLQITLLLFLYCTSVRLPESFLFLKIGDYQPRIKILGKKMKILSILLRTLNFCPEIFNVYFCRWAVRPQALGWMLILECYFLSSAFFFRVAACPRPLIIIIYCKLLVFIGRWYKQRAGAFLTRELTCK